MYSRAKDLKFNFFIKVVLSTCLVLVASQTSQTEGNDYIF